MYFWWDPRRIEHVLLQISKPKMLLRQMGKKQTAGSSCHLPSFLDKNEKRTTWDNFAGCQIHWTNTVTWDKAVWLLNLTVFSSVQWQQMIGLGEGGGIEMLIASPLSGKFSGAKKWMQVCVLAQIWRERVRKIWIHLCLIWFDTHKARDRQMVAQITGWMCCRCFLP